MSVKEAVKGALQGVLKGELQGAIKETIQGAIQEALQSVFSRRFHGALKGPPNRYKLKHCQGHF